jgi:hypothetical protein
MWQMPMDEEYREFIKGSFADIQNIGSGKGGGPITGAWFIREFAGDTPWIHLDIAGTAWNDDAKRPPRYDAHESRFPHYHRVVGFVGETLRAGEPAGVPTVLTPHDGEYARLAGQPVGDDRISAATRLATSSCASKVVLDSCANRGAEVAAERVSGEGDVRQRTGGVDRHFAWMCPDLTD